LKHWIYYEVEAQDKAAFLHALTRYINFMGSNQERLSEDLKEEPNDSMESIIYQLIKNNDV